MATMDNLAEAFAGESQANMKYQAYAEKAEKDGYAQVARLFRAAAAAEKVHAHNHLRSMGGVTDSAGNLEDAVEGEGYEFRKMYPPFLEEAEKEGNEKAARSFRYALAVEEIHHGLYSRALESIRGGEDLPEKKVYVCSVCGNTVEEEPPEKCPVCGVPKEKFFLVE